MLSLAISLLPGCGLLFQLYSGYDREETTVEKVTHTLKINSLPRGAEVQELDGDRRVVLGTTPVQKKIEYQRELTVVRPNGMAPFWIGTIVDLGLVVGTGIFVGKVITPRVKNEDNR